MILPQWEVAGWAFVLRSLLLAGVCALLAGLFRSRTAALRFMLWRWMLFALFALPLLTQVIPPLFRRPVGAVMFPSVSVVNSGIPRWNTKLLSKVEAPHRHAPLALLPPGVYLFIAVALLARLGYSLVRLRRITERSQFISDVRLHELFSQIWLENGAGLRPRIMASNAVSAPIAFNAGESWILLPQSWQGWDPGKLRAVLTHEMAHVKRGDAATLLLASFATCLFWFHPLSWFLQRKLAALAEEACDEAVLARGTAPEQYANLLIDFARDVQVAGAIGVAGRSSLKRRIELLFADRQNTQRGIKMLTALALVLFIPALYLAAAVQPGGLETRQHIPWPSWSQVTSPSAREAAALESAVQANPEDLDKQMQLLCYFSYRKQEIPFTNQLLWFIQHHPETETLPMAEMVFHSSELLGPISRSRTNAAWEQAVVEHAGSPIVLVNAANSLMKTNPERGLRLLRAGEALDFAHREKYDHAIAVIYAAAELQGLRFNGALDNIQMNEAAGVRLRAQLRNSGDPALLAETGRLLTQLTLPGGSGEPLHRGLALIHAAIQLDPGNAQWTEALQSAEAEPQRALNYERIRRRLAVANAAK